MDTSLERHSIEKLEKIMEQSFNYDKIRIEAISLLRDPKYIGISEKCRIIFNPMRHLLITRPNDFGIGRYFDIEEIEPNLDYEIAYAYKQAFVWSLDNLESLGGELIE